MKDLRLRRLINHKTGKLLITPLDHGVTLGPICGIQDIRSTVKTMSKTQVNAVVLHKGNVVYCGDIIYKSESLAVILHLSASVGFSPNNDRKVLVASVEEGAKLGVDAVSVHINLGNEFDYQMINDLGKVSEECQKWGMPLLAMMYPRGKNIDERDLNCNMVAARVAMELGADIVKVNYTGDKKSFEKIVNGVNIPVVIAGGTFDEDGHKFLKDIKDAMDVGAAGVAIGRNVFQRSDMVRYINGIDAIVNQGADLKGALQIMEEYRWAGAKTVEATEKVSQLVKSI